MKFKNKELAYIYNGLKKVVNVDNRKIKYNMGRNKKMLLDEITEYNNEISKIRKEHCKVDKNGEFVTTENEDGIKNLTYIDKKHRELFIKEIEELNEAECDLPIRTITFEDYEKDTGNITPEEVDYLLFMIEDDNAK